MSVFFQPGKSSANGHGGTVSSDDDMIEVVTSSGGEGGGLSAPMDDDFGKKCN